MSQVGQGSQIGYPSGQTVVGKEKRIQACERAEIRDSPAQLIGVDRQLLQTGESAQIRELPGQLVVTEVEICQVD